MSNHNKNNTEIFYKEIISKVCERVKEEFLNEGVAEDVLSELKKIWNEKLINIGIFPNKYVPSFFIKNVHTGINHNNLVQIHQNIFQVHDVNKMNYAPLNVQNIGIPNIPKNNPIDNQFKSDPNKTTSENCKMYLEQRNISSPIEIKPTQIHTLMSSENNSMSYRRVEDTEQNQNYIKHTPNNMNLKNNIPIPNINHAPNNNLPTNDDESSDSDAEVFKKNEPKIEDVEEKPVIDDDEESLSSLSNESEHIVVDSKDYLLAQYEKVHRVRNKWKCVFKDAILHINGKEHVFDRVNAELERDW